MWKALAAAAVLSMGYFLSTSVSPFSHLLWESMEWSGKPLLACSGQFQIPDNIYDFFWGEEGLLALYLLAIFGEKSLSQAEPARHEP